MVKLEQFQKTYAKHFWNVATLYIWTNILQRLCKPFCLHLVKNVTIMKNFMLNY